MSLADPGSSLDFPKHPTATKKNLHQIFVSPFGYCGKKQIFTLLGSGSAGLSLSKSVGGIEGAGWAPALIFKKSF